MVDGSRPAVLVLATGGTIGMRVGEHGLAPDPGFPEALKDLVAEICGPLGADHRINHLHPPIDSANADADTARRIARTVGARVRTSGPRGVVVLHGTDTLAYTAARLAYELSDLGTPVVLTGAQHPHGAEDGDARSNLSLAVKTSLRARRDAPVSIAFGRRLLPAVRATKHQAEAIEAFRAERPLATGATGVPAQLRARRDRLSPARVISFRFVPGVAPGDLRAIAGAGPDGLVLECYGTGNAPLGTPGMREALRAVAAELPVVAITQCATGSVDFGRYAVAKEMRALGVIDGGDMTLEAALGKLAFAVEAGLSGSPLGSFMQLNVLGERST
ncbi:asparaginase [Leucobacter weissii]|uniref:asparaginase n=1 Tax=Leucobacter weissii TaxID=1983706 RepID=A0A939S8K2_9MICO|nr:asparaginase domain-containing protein [Leucobacter weissii]MBO1902186.1 asparaginase [Leucobacter weissii]